MLYTAVVFKVTVNVSISATCQSNGQWSRSVPQCNGMYIEISSHVYWTWSKGKGITFTFTCNMHMDHLHGPYACVRMHCHEVPHCMTHFYYTAHCTPVLTLTVRYNTSEKVVQFILVAIAIYHGTSSCADECLLFCMYIFCAFSYRLWQSWYSHK